MTISILPWYMYLITLSNSRRFFCWEGFQVLAVIRLSIFSLDLKLAKI
ncbi:hypothetical protein GXM_05007 [Nostoc sphaeroides CCNUC1]|uniref:Uncharacterized protein n=1 Tax=Nostoc sphaeroides CCNUC1 TaxID=2653204 RepID=A0A5P8W446_9NOSO|nr:hypothetical protein GXM_05007 [Nostoc sphaeroides CCNUC1]